MTRRKNTAPPVRRPKRAAAPTTEADAPKVRKVENDGRRVIPGMPGDPLEIVSTEGAGVALDDLNLPEVEAVELPAEDFTPDISVSLDSDPTDVEEVVVLSVDVGAEMPTFAVNGLGLPDDIGSTNLEELMSMSATGSGDTSGALRWMIERDARAFVNRLKLLTFMDADDIEGVGLDVSLGGGVWPAFRDNPFRWMIQASAEDAAAVYELLVAVEAHQKETGHG